MRLIRTRQGGGISTLLDLRQGEQLVYTASETIPTLQEQIEQTENQISLLLARNPAGIVRGRGLTEQELPPEVPAGLPSALLDRRPDIRAAEQSLVAANANIGVAKAAYFPQISLSGLLGGQSTQLASLFSGPHSTWSFVPQITQPIFTAGRLKSGVRLAQAQEQGALIQYQKTIQTSFTEVSDALIARQRQKESRVEQDALVTALRDRTRLAYVRDQGGVDTLLNALDADRDLFQSELTLARNPAERTAERRPALQGPRRRPIARSRDPVDSGAVDGEEKESISRTRIRTTTPHGSSRRGPLLHSGGVPALRELAVHEGLSDGSHVDRARWHRGDRLRLVHRLQVLHGGLPLWRAALQLGDPTIPAADLNPNTRTIWAIAHGRRELVEKCTFCIQRTRAGRYPACVEVCPVGARKFGNLLDKDSEIRYIIEHKRVLVLKEVNTVPRFFYFYAT